MKEVILTDRHWDELTDDVSDRIWAVWGQAVHSLMESEGETDFTEQQMSFPVGGITVTGRIDNYDMKSGVVCDYKTASVVKVQFGDFNDWYMQGMIYAWLLTKNKFPVNHCRFIALLKDHSKTDSKRDYQYPKEPVYVYEFPVTAHGLFKTGVFIKNRKGGSLPPAPAPLRGSSATPSAGLCPATPRWGDLSPQTPGKRLADNRLNHRRPRPCVPFTVLVTR